jgi:hypothetical protein
MQLSKFILWLEAPMFKTTPLWLATLSALILPLSCARAQNGPGSGLYQIRSGSYIECCGIAGDFHYSLPNQTQAFIQLTVNTQSTLASMAFLGEDMQTVFQVVPCPPGDAIPFSFNYGLVFSNTILFHVDPGPPPYQMYWNYMVSNSVNQLRIDGALVTLSPGCADVPTHFSHGKVVAVPVLLPTAAVRVSEVEVCWNTVSNKAYQVQYRSTLTSNIWTSLGPSRTGDGATNCLADKVLPGQPQRFYRVLPLP